MNKLLDSARADSRIPPGFLSPCVWLLAVFVMSTAFAKGARPDAAPRLEAKVPGFLFIEGESTTVELVVPGPVRKGSYSFEIADQDTPWKASGRGTFTAIPAGETKRIPLELGLPERGFYRLTVSGKASGSFSLETPVAMTFEPRVPASRSPWGVFYIPPSWFDAANPEGAAQVAESLRRLGASWVRLNFWAPAFEQVVPPSPSGALAGRAEFQRWRLYANELDRRGLQILGTIAQVPRALSSDPLNERTHGDGGPAYHRSKPADYGVWEQLMEQTSRSFADLIDVWEIWNEPDNGETYWKGSIEDFAKFAQHTAAGLRRGNPQARIAGCGFTADPGALWYADIALRLGLAKHLDILTVHYTDEDAGLVTRWRDLLQRHGRPLPIWNTEERSPAPVADRGAGVERTFKFLHVAVGYENDQPLVARDYTLRAAGMAFSVAARLLGGATFVRTHATGTARWWVFQDGSEQVVFVEPEPLALFPPGKLPVTVRTRVRAKASSVSLTNLRGKARLVIPNEKQEIAFELPPEGAFLTGVVEVLPLATPVSDRVEAEDATYPAGWERRERRFASGGSVLEWQKGTLADSPLDLVFSVPRDGQYELLLAMPVVPPGRPAPSLSWRLDSDPEHAPGALPAVVEGQQRLGVRRLGQTALAAGEHRLRLRFVPPSDGGQGLRLTVDAVAVRAVPGHSKASEPKKD